MDPNSAEIKKLNNFINSLKQNVNATEPLMTKIAGIMHAGVERNFEEEGRPQWTALAKSTERDRRRKGFSPKHPILRRTLNLINSIIPRSTETQSIVATSESYAEILHYGGTINHAARSEIFQRNRYVRGKKKGKFKKGTKRGQGFSLKAYTIVIPPRPFMLIKEPEVDEIINAVKDHILK